MAKRKPSRNPLIDLSDRAKNYTSHESQEEPKTYLESLGQVATSAVESQPIIHLATRRKRRKDAIWPEGTKDRHRGSQTLAVRVPDDLAAIVREEARVQGVSVNALMLSLLENRYRGLPVVSPE
jgi:hypothetical protein